MRIYNRALSASEVQQLYGLGAGTHVNTSSANLQNGSTLQNGLMGLWTFDGSDISGSTVYDLSGNGNNGSNNGATPTIGKLGQALKFSGSSNVDLGHNSSLDSSSFSFSFWIKMTSVNSGADSNSNIIMGRESYATSGFRMGVSGANSTLHFWTTQSGGTVYMNSSVPLSIGTFYHVVVTYNGSVGTMYLNAVQQDQETGTYVVPVGDDWGVNSGIGGVTDSNSVIDDVRIYNRALSASEVQQLYLMGK